MVNDAHSKRVRIKNRWLCHNPPHLEVHLVGKVARATSCEESESQSVVSTRFPIARDARKALARAERQREAFGMTRNASSLHTRAWDSPERPLGPRRFARGAPEGQRRIVGPRRVEVTSRWHLPATSIAGPTAGSERLADVGKDLVSRPEIAGSGRSLDARAVHEKVRKQGDKRRSADEIRHDPKTL